MSGTSADSIDAALVNLDNDQIQVVATEATPLPPSLRQQILSLYQPDFDEIDRLGSLDREIAIYFGDTVLQLLRNAGIDLEQVCAIGSHGQTIRHRPRPESGLPFTMQIGDPNVIAEQTGITTVADFRRRDMTVGGQGAPLVPGFHRAAFGHAQRNRAVINIGGIANITWLAAAAAAPIGYDIGPGNGLMDAWIWQHHQRVFDADGTWAAQGKVVVQLLNQLLQHPYFQMQPPKSTGREEFHLSWLKEALAPYANVAPVDVQATLLELTAVSVANEVKRHARDADVFICGGGARNEHLMARLREHLSGYSVATTAALGIPADFVEAVAFAWLAMRTLHHLPGNVPEVTGATREAVLGAVYPGRLGWRGLSR